ncbi:hypothetical protein L1987_64925 [Smallanthus sonchifolius]|uniref:Uncharacterized protein n=1 Tax=Smallanthus sonchifolius TaxID=185202 RepID=A0ACB9BT23_9ASTR|nr:hypothetical protein L1987_64925 [Smallanthus sonchifolius]
MTGSEQEDTTALNESRHRRVWFPAYSAAILVASNDSAASGRIDGAFGWGNFTPGKKIDVQGKGFSNEEFCFS